MNKVQVLLSTFNGADYVVAQIESILNQTHRNTSLFIRDDGSTDATLTIIEQYAKKYPQRIQFIKGSNIGVINSFTYLLHHSDHNSDYYCFCDQDDIWLPTKIEHAIAQLNKVENCPAMLFTATQMTDDKLKPIKIWPKPSKEPSFYNALVQNIAVGTTITMNKEARDLLCEKKPDTSHIIMHDWWAYLCISAFGTVYFDPKPSILYRQHDSNVVGGNLSLLDTLRRKWTSFQKHRGNHLLAKQALEFKRLYGDRLEGAKREQLDLFLAERRVFRRRIKYSATTKLYRQSFFEQLLFKFLIIIGYI